MRTNFTILIFINFFKRLKTYIKVTGKSKTHTENGTFRYITPLNVEKS